jgi:hypothetical protein
MVDSLYQSLLLLFPWALFLLSRSRTDIAIGIVAYEQFVDRVFDCPEADYTEANLNQASGFNFTHKLTFDQSVQW